MAPPVATLVSPRTSDVKAYRIGTHRVVDPCVTLARLLPKLGMIGVTRMANVTGLDYVGIPVCAAVRPNSRNLSVHQGKGLTLDAAKASAVMEALEWYSGEQSPADAVWRPMASFEGGLSVVPRHLARGRLRHDAVIPWVEGFDLVKGRSSFVPEELVTTDFTRPRREGFGWFRASSNGLAAGNTMTEALLHAICELIERDAFALWRLAPADIRSRTRIDPGAMSDPFVQTLADLYDRARMTVEAWDITSDIEVPSFFCVIDDRKARPPFLGRFGGAGCHPNAGVALCRALGEAAQSRLTFIGGSRDDIPLESYSVIGWQHNLTSFMVQRADPSPKGVASRRAVSFDAQTVEEDLDAVLTKLTDRGVDSIVQVDLTRPELDIPCVRVVIPRLEGMPHKPGYKPGKRARGVLRQWT
jgi:YcaO-like protein with predicted kinase domain